MSDPQALHVTRNVIPGKLGVDLHLRRVHIPLVDYCVDVCFLPNPGYADNGVYWRAAFESDDFEEVVEKLWSQVRPLYEQLHAYVRRKLIDAYPGHRDGFPKSGHIPAHLTGGSDSHSPRSLSTAEKMHRTTIRLRLNGRSTAYQRSLRSQ